MNISNKHFIIDYEKCFNKLTKMTKSSILKVQSICIPEIDSLAQFPLDVDIIIDRQLENEWEGN